MAKSGPMINIGGDEKDTSYRYKMPPLITKVEGRGNGIKTILMNITDVCKHLHTEPQYATRFFGIECGAVSKWDDKRDAGVVHGVHDKADLQKHLKKFIRDFILCPKCHLPELQMKVNKKSKLMIRCGACGEKGINNSTHKVKTFMINHPPKSKPRGPGAKSRKPQGAGTTKKDTDMKEDPDSLAKAQASDINQLGGANDEKWSVDVSDEAVARRKMDEMKTLAGGNSYGRDGADGVDGAKDELNGSEANGKLSDDDDDDDDDADKNFDPYRSLPASSKDDSGPAQILRAFVKDKNREIYEILDEMKRLGMAHGLDDAKKFKVTFEATCKFDSAKKFINSLKKNAKLFKELNRTDKDSDIFFACLEEVICKRNPDELLPKTPMILEAIYDADIATDDQILKWHSSESDKALLVLRDEAEQVRAKAKPFINWLEEDDDEEDDEDGDDGDEVEDVE